MRTNAKQVMMWGTLSAFYVYVVGPLVFMALEGGPVNEAEQVNISAIKLSLSLELNMSAKEVDLVFTRLRESSVLEVVAEKSFDPWTYASSVTFSWTLISTVGWGYIAPVTFWGRIFSIFYSLFGIPLYALFLRCAGVWFKELLASGLEKLESRVRGANNVTGLHIKSSLLLLFLTIVILLCGAEVFSRRNGWTYFEGFYFCYISLTTIGLGDLYYVFHENEDFFFIDIFGCLIFIWGLCLVSTFLCQMSETLEELNYNGKKIVAPLEDKEAQSLADEVSQNEIYEIEEDVTKDNTQSIHKGRKSEASDSVENASHYNRDDSNSSKGKPFLTFSFTRNEKSCCMGCLRRHNYDSQTRKDSSVRDNAHHKTRELTNNGIMHSQDGQTFRSDGNTAKSESDKNSNNEQTNGEVIAQHSEDTCFVDGHMKNTLDYDGCLRDSCPYCHIVRADHEASSDCESSQASTENAEVNSVDELRAAKDDHVSGNDKFGSTEATKVGDQSPIHSSNIALSVGDCTTPKSSPEKLPKLGTNENKTSPQHQTTGKSWQTGVADGEPV